MIAHTLAQAADRLGLPLDVIEGWVRAGHLIAIRNPIDNQLYVADQHLVDLERATRTGAHDPPPNDAHRADPATDRELAAWLLERHGIDLGHGGPARIRQWAVRYPDTITRHPGTRTTYDRPGVLAIAIRLTRRHNA